MVIRNINEVYSAFIDEKYRPLKAYYPTIARHINMGDISVPNRLSWKNFNKSVELIYDPRHEKEVIPYEKLMTWLLNVRDHLLLHGRKPKTKESKEAMYPDAFRLLENINRALDSFKTS